MKAVYTTITFSIILYWITGCANVITFGSNIKNNFFDNMTNYRWDTVLLRMEYLFVICCHIPYFFFACKESLLCMIDET